MVAAGGDLVVGGEFLEEIHIGRQSGARERALEEIVAEERVFGDPSVQGRLEGVDVVIPLPVYDPSPKRSWYTSEIAAA